MPDEIEKWVEELMSAGCMPKVAARVVTAIYRCGFDAGVNSAPKDEAAERRRAWDRERKREATRKRKSADSGGNRVELEPAQWLWTEGQGLLRQLGVAEKSARSNIGMWMKAGHDPATIKQLLVDVHQKGIGNPIPWVTKALGNAKGRTNGTGTRNLATAADDLIDRLGGGERQAGPVIEHEPC